MPLHSRVSSLFRNTLRKRRVEQDLDEEVRSYLNMVVDEQRSAGLTHRDARRAALVELEGIDQVKERVRTFERERSSTSSGATSRTAPGCW